MKKLPEDANEQAIDAGWTTLQLDLGTTTSKSDLLGILATAGSFPPHFGHNWDAAADSLQDLSWLEGRAFVMLVRAADPFQTANSALATVFIDVLSETVEYWADRGVPFQVLWEAELGQPSSALGGPGPDNEDAMASFPIDGARLGSVAAWPTPNTSSAP